MKLDVPYGLRCLPPAPELRHKPNSRLYYGQQAPTWHQPIVRKEHAKTGERGLSVSVQEATKRTFQNYLKALGAAVQLY